MRPLLSRAADALAAVGLAGPAFRVYERLQALRGGGEEAATAEDGVPVPPPYLRVLTAGAADRAAFLQAGERAAALFQQLAAESGAPLSAQSGVLDFGCGCGRVARYLGHTRLSGCDIQERLVAWCARNLAGEFRTTRPDPPLPYADDAFDLVYSVSVFTHLYAPSARAWLAELGRVVRPGGLGLLTFFDEHLPAAATMADTLAADGFAVRHDGPEGSNLMCGYFSSTAFAAAAEPHWRLVRSIRSDHSGIGQAVAVFERL